jgi:cardiolipin synthase
MAEPAVAGSESVYRHRRPRLHFAGGHRVCLLQNGDLFFPALIAAIDSARRSVQLETYIFNDDPSGQAVATALARAASRGVSVTLLVDGFGTMALQGEVARIISASAVQVRVFRPFRTIIGLRWRVLRRLHRKLCVVDGGVAFIGGINILDDRIDPRHGTLEAPRLDFALRVLGPLVADVGRTMAQVWSEAHAHSPMAHDALAAHDTRAASHPIPECPHASPGSALLGGPVDASSEWAGVRAALVLRDNLRNRRTIEKVYLRALGRARRDVLIASAYFLPGRRFRRALCAAARRGVRVRLLLQGRIEYPIPHLGSLSLYESLLREGVEIIEYRSSFLHAKVAIADDWVTVGSANIDPFSLLLAREANVVMRSAPIAEALVARLEREIQTGGSAIKLAQVEREPFGRRVATRLAWWLLRIGVAVSGRGMRY